MFDAGFSKGIKTILAAACCVVVAGCANVNYVRDAQDAFNRAVQKDNKDILMPVVDTQGTLVDEMEKRASYTAVIVSVDNISDADKSALMADKLWGTMLTIKAFSHWRLGGYNKAIDTYEQALKTPDQLQDRDRIMLEALPDLIRNDQAQQIMIADKRSGAHISDKAYWQSNIEGLLVSAIKGLGEHGKSQPENYQLALYLKQAQIAAAINLNESYRYYLPCSSDDTDCFIKQSENLSDLNTKLNDMAKIIFAIKNCEAKTDQLLQIWEMRVGKNVDSDTVFPNCS